MNILKEMKKQKKALQQIGIENIAISIITAMELFYGAIDKKELLIIKKAIQSLEMIPLNAAISEMALSLIEKYSKSHGLKIPDALIASTTIQNGLSLFTYNIKDFRFIKELQIYVV